MKYERRTMKTNDAHHLCASSFIVDRSSFRLAFTLVELMISIALVLLLVLGINQVFKLTGETVGSGQVINAQQRDMRAASKQMADDFAAAVTTGPCFIIGSSVQPAFRNANDAKTDPDYLALLSSGTLAGQPSPNMQTSIDQKALTLDINGTGTETPLSLFIPNSRAHRVDQLAFFARGSFHRQTGDPGTFVNSTTSSEAFINYGHLSLASNTINSHSNSKLGAENDYYYYPPGQIQNDDVSELAPAWNENANNLYASQWELGRSQILLTRTITDPLTYFYGPTNTNGVGGVGNSGQELVYPALSPLSAGCVAQKSGSQYQVTDPVIPVANQTQAYYMTWSNRFDNAQTSIDAFSTSIATFLRANAAPGRWFGNTGMLYRFRTNPFVTKPQTSRSTALATPALINSCTQFIVEFAGDFVTQDNDPTHLPGSGSKTFYGDVIDSKPDGIPDFIVPGVVLTASAPYNVQKQTRWYGFPRDANNDGTIVAIDAFKTRRNNDLVDVVPLRDVLRTMKDTTTGNTAAALPTSFLENFVGNPQFQNPPPNAPYDYATWITGTANYSFANRPQYWAAWQLGQYSVTQNGVTTTYTNPPKMIRIIITLDDPAGHLPDGQTFEYIYNLK